ncbi:DUF1311 domain-containing protein [Colwellia sp. E2M01]|nr:lysozyme inhibitor LprI family protein [Colwellia sp. E2M01]MBU2871488.1 DUF1311 domain-containing protein [Colwellia sp. E2M01]
MSSALLLLYPLLSLTSAHAASSIEECQNNAPEQLAEQAMSKCLDSVIMHVERELQTWVNLHTFALEEKAANNGRSSALNMFKSAQRSFVSYREDDCRWQYLAISPASGASIGYKKCFVVLSNARIAILKARESTLTP